MKTKNLINKLVWVLGIVVIVITTAYNADDLKSSAGKAGKTGSPGESDCTACHGDFPLNSGGGSVVITSNIPNWSYTPSQTYTITVTVSQTGMTNFSFGFEALSGTTTYANAGTFTITNPNETQIKTATISGVSRNNVVQVSNGGLATNTKSFSFNWTAPATNVGNVTFYVSSCACDNDGGNAGDYVYNTTQVVTPASTVTAPTVITTAASAITSTTAATGGNVTSAGGGTITARGVCYGTTTNPDITGTKTSDGTGTGTFTSSLSGLTPGTTYHIRAYATNSAGTSYGSDLTFTTSATAPTVTTTAASAITSTTAATGGNVTSAGGGTITARGVCYGTTTNPDITGTKTSDGTGTGTFTSSLSGLTPGTTYHIRAYATNSAGTSYGSDLTFTTSVTAPTVTTTAASAITTTTASAGGNVTSAGGGTITARGVCYGTTTNPDITGTKTSDGTGTGTFTSSLSGLTPGTTYHIRAYATNSAGTSYGSDLTFTTSAQTYSVSGTVVYKNTAQTVISGATVNLLSGTTIVATTTTNPNGYFTFSNVANGSYTISISTNIAWGGVTSVDVLKVKRHVAGLETITEPVLFSAADVNITGSITSTDALVISRRVIGLDTSFTRPDWIFEIQSTGGNSVTVNGSNVTVNFYGICAGDVNGTYTPIF